MTDDIHMVIDNFEEKQIILPEIKNKFSEPKIIMATVMVELKTSYSDEKKLMNIFLNKFPNSEINRIITKEKDISFNTEVVVNENKQKPFGPSLSLHINKDNKKTSKIKMFPIKKRGEEIFITLVMPGINNKEELGLDNKNLSFIKKELENITETIWNISKHEVVLSNYKIVYNDSKIRMNEKTIKEFLKKYNKLYIFTNEKTIYIKIPAINQKKINKIKYSVSIQITGNFKFMIKLGVNKQCILDNSILLLNLIFNNPELSFTIKT